MLDGAVGGDRWGTEGVVVATVCCRIEGGTELTTLVSSISSPASAGWEGGGGWAKLVQRVPVRD